MDLCVRSLFMVFNVDNAHDAFISFGFVCAHALVRFIADT